MNQDESNTRKDEVNQCCSVGYSAVLDTVGKDAPFGVSEQDARKIALLAVTAYRAAIRADRLAHIQ
jgi:hypothetical protein